MQGASKQAKSKTDTGAPAFPLVASLLNGMPVLFWATDSRLRLTTVAGGAFEKRPIVGRIRGKAVLSLFESPEARQRAAAAHEAVLQGHRRSFIMDLAGR